MTMWVQAILISIGAVSVVSIKIPLQPLENTKAIPAIQEQFHSLPIYYPSEDANVFLVDPDSHKLEEVIRDAIPTPVTYLLPPSADKQNEYFVKPTEPGEQTEWYPIAATPAKQQEIIPLSQQQILVDPNEARATLRTGKNLHRGQVLTVPSRNLLPPRENAHNDFVVLSLSPELELPLEEIDHMQNQQVNIELPVLRPPLDKPRPVFGGNLKTALKKPLFRMRPESIPVPFMKPPENDKLRNPTRLYPKKYVNEFMPISIPVSQYEEQEKPTVIPESHDAVIHHDIEYDVPSQDKNNYLYEELQKKRRQHKELAKPGDDDSNKNEEVTPSEQQASESSHRHHNNQIQSSYPRKESLHHKPEHKSKGERTEFRMHGMKGPHSYQFGYDTGKGKNRQFRYEERDNDGHVRGHYGYVDKFGKLRVVNYDADPEHGFRAEAPVVKD